MTEKCLGFAQHCTDRMERTLLKVLMLEMELSTGTYLIKGRILRTMHIFMFRPAFSTHGHIQCMPLSHLTFFAEQAAPVGVTHTLPGFLAGAMVTAWKCLTLVTQITLPAIMAPRKIRAEERDGCVCGKDKLKIRTE